MRAQEGDYQRALAETAQAPPRRMVTLVVEGDELVRLLVAEQAGAQAVVYVVVVVGDLVHEIDELGREGIEPAGPELNLAVAERREDNRGAVGRDGERGDLGVVGVDAMGLRSVLRILIIFALTTPFWSLFDQKASTWVLQGNQMAMHSNA